MDCLEPEREIEGNGEGGEGKREIACVCLWLVYEREECVKGTVEGSERCQFYFCLILASCSKPNI